MTLLELLVQELPKIGGWPEETSELITQDGDGTVRCWVGSVLFMVDNDWCIKAGDHRQIILPKTPNPATDYNTAIITREQYEAALAAAKQLVWNGAGLPPVGCECEYVGNDTSWGIVKVIGHDGDKVVFKPSGDDYYAIAPSNKCIFLPIRSEADKKRDAVIHEIAEAMVAPQPKGNGILAQAISVYNKIAAGKIPGVKLED